MSPKIKSAIETIVAVTISLIMFGSIVSYFYVGYYGYPLFIVMRYIFATIIINSIGILVLANLATVNKGIKIYNNFFIGIFISLYLILGLVKSTYSSMFEVYFALAMALMISFMIAIYFEIKELKIKNYITIVLIAVFGIFGLIGFFSVPEASTSIQTNQTVFAITALFALSILFDPIRDYLKNKFHVDFSSQISVTALVMSVLLIGFGVYILLVLSSFGGFLNYISKGVGGLVSPNIALYQLAFFISISLFGVGLFTRRKFLDVLKRLGLVLPSWRDLKITLMFVVILFAINYFMERIGISLKLINPSEDKALSETIYAGFNTFSKMLVLAFAAGIGEEILFRGAMQPKFGIIFTTLIFTLIHGQYQIFGLLTVFLLGITLSYQRKLTNTTSVIISHFVYDLIGLAVIFLV